ncbi:MAG: flagellar protein FliS [Colwellia sp.]|jgi:flagellar protein FliS
MRQNLKAYKKVDIESSIMSSEPHQIIVMMFDGALQSLAIAKGAIDRKDFELKSQSISKFSNIISALRNSLDFDAEPVVSQNFDELYVYCLDVINDISVSMDASRINDIIELLKPLRNAWFEMSETDKKEGHSLLIEKNKLAKGA